MKLGFVGIGNMGGAMAKRLIEHGVPLKVFDLNSEYVNNFESMGALGATNLREIGEVCDLVFLSLPKSSIVEEVVLGKDGLSSYLSSNSIIIDTTTADPTSTRFIGNKLAKKRIKFLDAPVTGGPIGCDRGTLSMMVGGDRETYQQCHTYLSIIAPKNLNYVGSIGSGHMMKIANNIIAATNRWAVAEGTILAAKVGLDPKKVLDVINKSSGWSYHTQVVWPEYILTGEISQGFSLGLMCKDIDLALDASEKLDSPGFMMEMIQMLYHSVRMQLGHEVDVNNVITYLEDLAKIKVRYSKV